MRHQLSIVYFLGLLLCSQSGNAQDSLFTLHEVWGKAIEHNKELKFSRLEVGKGEVLLKDAKSERLPEINANGSYSRLTNMPIYENGIFHRPTVAPVINQSYSIGAEASLNLYHGGKARREISIKKVELEATLNQQQLSLADVKFKSASYFYELIRNLQLKKLTVQEIVYEEKQLTEIGHLYKNGTVLKSDLLRAELKISNQKMLLSEIENNITLSVQQLNIIMGRADQATLDPVVENIELVEPYALSYEDYLAIAYKNSFEFRLSENAVALSNLNLKQVKSIILPKADFFTSYGYTYPQSQFYPYSDALFGIGQAGVKISMPISGLYLNKYKKEVADIKRNEQIVHHEIKQDEIRNAVRAAYLHYTEALERIEVAKKNITQATEALRILKSSYFNQQSLLTDLLDAETQLLQSKFDLTSAEVSAQVQFYQLQRIIGKI
ncbi:TolC family protein [Pedobacter sp. HMWF019]|uniref:TolC family protein n=1 Tax=Pedobacter sp. HMWF019 TaxID=2056856 RepID=UPI000D352E72|nr:TolC family protein [Pedobacter sp. HMWF019]PTS92358.1 TolC family protein [Pedobacter sp. HMWF019]